jgi:lycopene beta-cyclase
MKHYYIFHRQRISRFVTVYKMAKSGKFKEKTILLLDENQKKLMIVLGVSGK